MIPIIQNTKYNYYADSIIDLNIWKGIRFNLILAEENIYDNQRNITTDNTMLIGRLCKQYKLEFNKTIYIEHYKDIEMHNTRYPMLYNYVDFEYTIPKGVHNISWYPLYRDEITLLKEGKILDKKDIYYNDIEQSQIHESLGWIALRNKYNKIKN